MLLTGFNEFYGNLNGKDVLRRKCEKVVGGCAVLPDGIFSNQKFQFGKILERLAMEDVDFCGHFVSFKAKWFILWSFGKFYGHLVHFMAI
jgi:hypothetical protein